MWHSVRITYFEKELKSLLLGPVREFIQLLHQKHPGTSCFIQPHWKYGPHVCIQIECDQATFSDSIYPTLQGIVEPWLAQHPSTTKLDPKQYELLSKNIAITELEPGPYLPLWENNSVSVVPFVRKKALKVEALSITKEHFLSDTLTLSLDLLHFKQIDSEEVFILLIAMMAIAANTFEGNGMQRGFASYRSHAEYFFSTHDKEGQLRSSFDQLYSKHQTRLSTILMAINNQTLDAIECPDLLQQCLQNWQKIVDDTYRQNKLAVIANLDYLQRENVFDELAEDVIPNVHSDYQKQLETHQPSDISQVLTQSDTQAFLRSPEFMAYRNTINYFYLLLPIIGIPPVQKFALCHCTARSIEETFSVNWQDYIPQHLIREIEHG